MHGFDGASALMRSPRRPNRSPCRQAAKPCQAEGGARNHNAGPRLQARGGAARAERG